MINILTKLYAYQLVLRDQSHFVETGERISNLRPEPEYCFMDTSTRRRIFIGSARELDSILDKIPYIQHIDKEELGLGDFYVWMGFASKQMTFDNNPIGTLHP